MAEIVPNNFLYIVATPIGNLADMSFRAIDVLKSVDIIAAEDTRHSAKLLQHYHISTPLIPYHDHGSENQTQRLMEKLRLGENVALISDAGTPLISDPGYRIVCAARTAGFRVVPIPGACAMVAALCAAGLPTDKFSFEGFPPAKETARRAFFRVLVAREQTLIFYESTHRIKDSLRDMCSVFGPEREVVLAREISKTFETILHTDLGSLREVMAADANQVKGEIVVLLRGVQVEDKDTDFDENTVRTMRILLAELPLKQASSLAAKITGKKKNSLYQWALNNRAPESE